MALEAPLRSSTGNLQFPYPYQRDMASRPESDGFRSPFRVVSSPPTVTDSASLRPNSVNRISSNSTMNLMSPSDIVGPSPVTSNGTETTEIEDDVSEDVHRESTDEISNRRSELMMLTTNLPDTMRQPASEEAVSVIHAPESFASWVGHDTPVHQSQPSDRSSPKSNPASLAALNGTPEKIGHSSPPLEQRGLNGGQSSTHPARPPISTDVRPVRYSLDSATPRAQDLQAMLEDGSRLRSSSTSSLEKIDEQTEAEGDDEDYASDIMPMPQEHDEVLALRKTLEQCWTLCNSLSGLSTIHRTQVFNNSGIPDAHEKAWKTCWKLCQRLYDNRDEDAGSFSVRLNLDLCRDFCQALFDVRERKDETADSVLRVSFELNNHLYSAQDSRNLPEEFRERTLDFYITLCHRLMKQRSELLDETDHLLRACWALAEMLFNIRQNKRDGRPQEEEELAQAVQACWHLCDMFRDGWTQIRPERNTPRPSQTSFFGIDQSGRESRASNRSSIHSKRESIKSGRQEEKPRKPAPVPETPVTEFEDTPISPESRSPQMPNILVLGPTSDNGRGGRWSSSASNLSSYSKSSTRTSSTATTTAASEDPNVTRAKILVLRAAMNLGFNRDTISDPKTGSVVLQKFVQNLPAGSFGSLTSHAALLSQYKNSVLTDAIIPRNHTLPTRGKRVSAHDMAKAIYAMSKSSQRYVYLRDLFRFVFQFSLDEVEQRRNVSIVV
ncbi:Fc.00g018810.m01.CDS01 [Cosmosporella sp. VM-42]